MNLAALAAVASADDADRNALLPQTVYQGGGNRRFADTANVNIADHHHRHRQFFILQTAAAIQAAAQQKAYLKQARQRPQQQLEPRIRLLPVLFDDLM